MRVGVRVGVRVRARVSAPVSCLGFGVRVRVGVRVRLPRATVGADGHAQPLARCGAQRAYSTPW